MEISKMLLMMIMMTWMTQGVSANSPPRFLLDTNVGSEIVLRLTEGNTENKSILRWDKILNTECHAHNLDLRDSCEYTEIGFQKLHSIVCIDSALPPYL